MEEITINLVPNGIIQVWRIQSSCIRFFGYDRKRKYLRISFVGGGTYDYFFVDREFEILLKADSVGKAYRSLIKGRFPSRCLSEAEEGKWVKAVVGGFEVRQLQREIEEKEAELLALRKNLDDKILSLGMDVKVTLVQQETD